MVNDLIKKTNASNNKSAIYSVWTLRGLQPPSSYHKNKADRQAHAENVLHASGKQVLQTMKRPSWHVTLGVHMSGA